MYRYRVLPSGKAVCLLPWLYQTQQWWHVGDVTRLHLTVMLILSRSLSVSLPFRFALVNLQVGQGQLHRSALPRPDRLAGPPQDAARQDPVVHRARHGSLGLGRMNGRME